VIENENTEDFGIQINQEGLCETDLIEVTNDAIHWFSWSSDGKSIYYVKEDDRTTYWAYRIDDGKSVHLDQLDFTHTPSAKEIVQGKIPESINSQRDANISYSPSGNQAVFAVRDNSKPTPTSQSKGSPNEPFGLSKDIYVVNSSNLEPNHIGSITGQISGFEWFDDEKKILIYMSPRPVKPDIAYIWTVNVERKIIEPFIRVNEYNKGVVYKGLSPNGRWLIFALLEDREFPILMKNTENQEEKKLMLSTLKWFWWIPDGKHLLIIYPTRNKADISSVYSYNIFSDQFIQISDCEFAVNPFYEYSASFSREAKSIAYIERDTNRLYILPLAYDRILYGEK
jgi:Tol biopolymer transport system component